MIDITCAKEEFNILNIPRLIKFRRDFRKNNPTYFKPDGLVAFVGGQGTGKTLSSVNYVKKILENYPCCKLVTNVDIKDYPVVDFQDWYDENIEKYQEEMLSMHEYKFKEFLMGIYIKENRIFRFTNDDDFKKYNNGKQGVVFFVDEIQLYLNSLESKNINIEVITQISQQRKQRKHIVCTSQVFGRMAKPLREQFSCVISCKNYMKMFQVNKLIDRDSLEEDNSSDTKIKGKVKKHFFYFHSPKMYEQYDTMALIERNRFRNGTKIDMYGGETNGIATSK